MGERSGEVAMPGYGLYDRALGISYLQGLHEAVVKSQMSAEIDQKAGNRMANVESLTEHLAATKVLPLYTATRHVVARSTRRIID